ncbi:MAG: glycosyltransferase family 39 protein [Deltaproteobacteria bacterium]|nr:glycosyltransferase family 39 protein [Deltaproteobacteria bacterium]
MNGDKPLDYGRALVLAVLASALIFGVWARIAGVTTRVTWHDELLSHLRACGWSSVGFENRLQRELSESPKSAAQMRDFLSFRPHSSVASTIQSSFETPHLPLYYALLHGWYRIWGPSLLAGRAFSICISLLGVVAAYAFARRVASERFASEPVGMIAAAIVSVSPFQVYHSQEIRMYGLLTLMSFLSSAVVLSAGWSRRSWGWFALLTTFGLLTHLIYALVVAAQILGAIRLHRLRPALLAALISCGIAAPWYAQLLQRRPDPFHFALAPIETWRLLLAFVWSMTSFFVDLPFDRWSIHVEGGGAFPIGALFVALILIVACGACARRGQLHPVLLLGILAPITLLAADLLAGGQRSAVPRYLTPAFAGLTGVFAIWISAPRDARWRFARRALGVGVLALGAYSSCQPTTDPAWAKPDVGATDTREILHILRERRPHILIAEGTAESIVTISHELAADLQVEGSILRRDKADLARIFCGESSPLMLLRATDSVYAQVFQPLQQRGLTPETTFQGVGYVMLEFNADDAPLCQSGE